MMRYICSFVLLFLCITALFASATTEDNNRAYFKVLNDLPPTNRMLCMHIPAGGSTKLSGVVTAYGADGKKARIYCENFSTEVTITRNSANYVIEDCGHEGKAKHVITAEVPGFKPLTKTVTWRAGQSDAVCNFVLQPIAKEIILSVSPRRIPPDGQSKAVITATIKGPAGKLFAGEAVSWTVDSGTVVSSDSKTDENGQARLVLKSGASPGAIEVAAISGDVKSRCMVDIAPPDAPLFWIIYPRNGDVVSGDVDIWVYSPVSSDNGAEPGGIAMRTVYVDGKTHSETPSCCAYRPQYWATCEVPNGKHTLSARVLGYKGVYGYSNTVTVVVQNHIADFSVEPEEITANVPVRISAKLAGKYKWYAKVIDLNDAVVWQKSGVGNSVDVVWPGTTATGLYTVTLSVNDGPALEKLVVFNP